MKTMAVACSAVILAISWFGVICAAEVRRSELVMVWATVKVVDRESRMMILQSPDGSTFDIKVREDVRNLSWIEPGDEVTVRYYRSMLLQIAKSNRKAGSSTSADTETTMPGEKLGGPLADQLTTTTTILHIDNRDLVVTFIGSRGNILSGQGDRSGQSGGVGDWRSDRHYLYPGRGNLDRMSGRQIFSRL
jgi:hypothetical protein